MIISWTGWSGGSRGLLAAITLVVTLGVLVAPGVGQGVTPPRGAAEAGQRRGAQAEDQAAPPRPEWRERREAYGERGRGPGRPPHARWGMELFEPKAEDHSPLQPGEQEELLQFARRHFPAFAEALDNLASNNPRMFREHFGRLAARLRHLRRMHAHNPELAALVAEHGRQVMRIEMLRRAWRGAREDARGVIESRMRECLAEVVRTETAALLRWADDLEANRETLVAERLAALTAPDADLSPEPRELRGTLEAWRSASDEAQRAELRAQLVAMLGRQIDRKVAFIRRRAAEIQAHAAEEVDRRMERLLDSERPRRPRP